MSPRKLAKWMSMVALLPLRLPYGRTLRVAGHEWQLLLEPVGADGQNAVEWQGDAESAVALRLTDATVQQLAQNAAAARVPLCAAAVACGGVAGRKDDLKDTAGKVVDVIG